MNRTTFFATLFLILLFSCKDDTLSLEKKNEESLNRLVEICWNQKNLTIIDSIFAENSTRTINNVKIAVNRAELSANMQVYFMGFPDFNMGINIFFSKGNQIFLDWTMTGTNTGVFGEVKATGKKVKISGFTRIIFNEEGKILHEDIYFNELELLQQLGYTLIPPNVN